MTALRWSLSLIYPACKMEILRNPVTRKNFVSFLFQPAFSLRGVAGPAALGISKHVATLRKLWMFCGFTPRRDEPSRYLNQSNMRLKCRWNLLFKIESCNLRSLLLCTALETECCCFLILSKLNVPKAEKPCFSTFLYLRNPENFL